MTRAADAERALDSALAAMRARYIETSRDTLRTLAQLGDRLGEAPGSRDLIDTLRRELHRVRGTAGSLGFHEAGRMAGALEGVARSWRSDPALDRDRRSEIVRTFARALGNAIAPPDDEPVTGTSPDIRGLASDS